MIPLDANMGVDQVTGHSGAAPFCKIYINYVGLYHGLRGLSREFLNKFEIFSVAVLLDGMLFSTVSVYISFSLGSSQEKT